MAGTLEQARRPASDEGWLARPVLARSLRWTIFCVPLLCSVLVTLGTARLLPAQSSLFGRAVSSLVILAVGIVAHRATAQIANRLLPLASLLRISMALPDAAPSRFSIALRRGSSRQLEHPEDSAVEATTADEILRLVKALNHHDRATRGHSERVRAYSELIGRELGLSDSDVELLRWAALLHDVGKLEVPADILDKDGKPTDEEFVMIRNHTVYGSRMIAPLTPWLGEWAWAVLQHHERWDGKGYPHGIAGEEISLAGRIVAVADVFDVMTSVRSYKKAQSFDQAREELVRCAGTQFDPAIVRAFLRVSQAKLRTSTGLLSGAAGLLQVGSAAAPSTVGPVAGAVGAATSAAVAATVGGYLAPVELPDRPRLLPESSPSPAFDDLAARVAEALESTTTTVRTALPLPPEAPLLVRTVGQGETIDFDLLNGVEDQQVVAKLRSAPLLGTLAEVGAGRFRYTPDPEAIGDDSFDFAFCIEDRCTDGRVGITIVNGSDPTTATIQPDSELAAPPITTPTSTTANNSVVPPPTATTTTATTTDPADIVPPTVPTNVSESSSTSATIPTASTQASTPTTIQPSTTSVPPATSAPTTQRSTTTRPTTTTTTTTTTRPTTTVPVTTTAPSTTTTAPGGTPQISATTDANKSVDASGAISGDLYIYVADDATVDSVVWFVDDIYGKRAPHQIENHAPFDFGGTIGAGPGSRPLDTTTLTGGSHTVTAKITEHDGTVRWQNYTFWVDNDR